MSGTVEGGKKAAATNKARYGQDFYKRNGAKGGRNGCTGGFAGNSEAARLAGRKGGKISRRGASVSQRLINNKEEVFQFIERYSYRDTANYYGVSYTTLRNFISKYGD